MNTASTEYDSYVAIKRSHLNRLQNQVIILDEIALVLESNGYAHMTNAEGIAEILRDLAKAQESARLDNMFP